MLYGGCAVRGNSADTLGGKVAWITGGATGMGFATAQALSKAGVAIAIGSLTDELGAPMAPGQTALTLGEDRLQDSAQALREAGNEVLAQSLNVADRESVESCYQQIVDTLGPIDILVNAAGSSGRHTVVGHPDELWDAMLSVNLTGAYRTTKLCLPGMLERGWGRVVNFSSTAGLVGGELHAAYCAAKAGLLGLTRCVAIEAAARGVTCNAICPGWVATEQNYHGMEREVELVGLSGTSVEDYREMMAQKWSPQKRFLQPEEPGAYAAFLCSNAAAGITGEALRISGGSTW